MVKILEKQMENFQSGIDNVVASIRQGNEIAKEDLLLSCKDMRLLRWDLLSWREDILIITLKRKYFLN